MAHDPALYAEAFNLFLGRLIGQGIHRQVFECRIDATLVVKVEYDTDMFVGANAAEWKNWDESQYFKPMAQWLAPCLWISPNGRIMIQKKTEPIPKARLPKKLPVFLTDVKPENFGYLDGRVVVHDYPLLITSPGGKRMKKAEWF